MIEELADLADYIASFIQHKEHERVKRRGLTEQDKEMFERGFKRQREMQTLFDEVSKRNREEPYADPRCSKGYKPHTRAPIQAKSARGSTKDVKSDTYRVSTTRGAAIADEIFSLLSKD